MKEIEYKKSPIVVTKTEYRGVEFIDVRRYYTDKETEEKKPTRKGIALPLEVANAVAEAIIAENK